MGLEDVRLTDSLALAEIELYGEVVIAASASDHPLSVPELDRVLGVDCDADTGKTPAAGRHRTSRA